MIYYLTIGVILGLSAGFAPGPLLALVISETLQHDIRAGIKVSLAPVITDFPIILGSLFVFSQLANFDSILGVVSMLGGCFVLFMAYEAFRSKGTEINFKAIDENSLRKGILVNALSPHPYLFWITVGTPIITQAFSLNPAFPWAFMGAFFACLMGTKILLAILVGKYKSFLNGKAYLVVMRLLGSVLAVLAVILFIDGIKLLGISGT